MAKRYFVNGKLVSSEAAEDVAVPAPITPKGGSCQVTGETPPKELQTAADNKSESPSLEDLVASRRFLAISLPNCPQCDELAAALALRGVPREAVFVKWEKGSAEYPKLKAALAMHAGQSFTFPQVFADGVYQGGFGEVLAAIEAGKYDELFEEQFDVVPATVKRWVESKPMVIFSLPNCPQCDELRGMLKERGLPVENIFMKWDKAMPQYQSLKAQLIKFIGKSQFTFPQTFARSEYQGSFDEVASKLADGGLDEFFQDAFGIVPAKPCEDSASPPAAAIAFDEDF